MINIFSFTVICFLLTSCSSGKNLLSHSTVKTIPVASRFQALTTIEKHHRYITLQFEQSRDESNSKLKWPDTCLKDNKIGQLKDYGTYIISESVLYLETSDSPGKCAGTKNNFLMIYCDDDDFLREIITPSAFKPLDASKLCPSSAM